MKFILCIVFMLPGVCQAASVPSLTMSWHATGKPFAKLSGIDTNDVAVECVTTETPTTVKATCKAQLADMRTGNDTRDGHMRGYLDVEHFPKAELEVNEAKFGPDNFPWTGTLTLKGQAKPVHGTATVKGKDVWAQFTVNLNDWAIKPSFAGVGIEDEVTVTVKGTR